MQWLARIVASSAPAATILVRVIVGSVFLSEGLQKFLFPVQLGMGRFEKISIFWPHVMAPFVGIVEISCGVLILLGLFTRLAALPTITIFIRIVEKGVENCSGMRKGIRVDVFRTYAWAKTKDAGYALNQVCCQLFIS